MYVRKKKTTNKITVKYDINTTAKVQNYYEPSYLPRRGTFVRTFEPSYKLKPKTEMRRKIFTIL